MDDFHNLCGKGHHSMMKVIVRKTFDETPITVT
jgi:hypothetical protein